jgi:hypothetical protein
VTQHTALPAHFSLTTQLAGTSRQVWDAVVRMEQINSELGPFIHMTSPRAARDKTIADVPLGEHAFTSVVLLFGVLPIDLHFLKLAELNPGRGFIESSSSLANAVWRHERTVVAADSGGCEVTDRIGFRSRLPGLDRLILPLVRALFAHRHRRLAAHFGRAAEHTTTRVGRDQNA